MMAKGSRATVITNYMAEKYKFSRTQARSITARTIDVIVQPFEEVNIERLFMVAKLPSNLEEWMKLPLNNNQFSADAAFSKDISRFAGLNVNSQYN